MSVAVASLDDTAGEDTRQPALPMSVHPPASPVAVTLLAQARRGLADAGRERDPGERFMAAYLSALRAAAGVLAARGRPHRGRARPASTWVLLESTAPELREWAAFFASYSATQAAVQSGITGRVTEESAAELLRQSGEFVDLARRAIMPRVEGSAPAPSPPSRAAPCAKGASTLRGRSAGQRQGVLEFPGHEPSRPVRSRAAKRSRSG
jgi:hypothetical protein